MTNVWDDSTQTYHGGQEWAHLDQYVCDFSVTTNALGTPQEALNVACDRMRHEVLHYPAADFEPAISSLAKFLTIKSEDEAAVAKVRARLLMGNGASELIDLVTRQTAPGPWKSAPYFIDGEIVQYKEYERAAVANGRKVLPPSEHSKVREALNAIVNPSNPTGDYMTLPELQRYIESKCSDGSTVMVDESMLPWHSPQWLEHSLLAVPEWIEQQYATRKVAVYIVHSWTKIWSCPGLRVGSVVAPTAEHVAMIKQQQVPWSLNTAALAFTDAVVRDTLYMESTWHNTTAWRQHECEQLRALFPHWKLYGEPWISWVWIDTGSEETAAKAVEVCRDAGVPVRFGKYGYKAPRFIRIAVREPKYFKVLLEALTPLAAASGKKKPRDE